MRIGRFGQNRDLIRDNDVYKAKIASRVDGVDDKLLTVWKFNSYMSATIVDVDSTKGRSVPL